MIAFAYWWLKAPTLGRESVPQFSIPSVDLSHPALSEHSLQGSVSLLNVWATWCVACRREHELLMRIADTGLVTVIGLNYLDDRADAQRWLRRLGDPYAAHGFDADGKVASKFGVRGVPETYVLNANGEIEFRHSGLLTEEVWSSQIVPLIESLRATQEGQVRG